MEARPHTESAPDAPEGPARIPILPLRALQVVYAPGELFARLRERPAWLGALLLGGLLVATTYLLIPAEMWEQTFREQMMRSGRTVPEGFEMGGVAVYFGLIAGVLSWFLLAFVSAGVITVVFHFFLGDEGRYAQYLSVVAHGFLIAAIGGLLVVPIRLAQADPRLTLNLGLFVPSDSSSYPMRVLRMLDLFMIWSYLVMAVGVSKVDPRRSWGSAAVVLMIFMVGLAMIIAAFMPAV